MPPNVRCTHDCHSIIMPHICSGKIKVSIDVVGFLGAVFGSLWLLYSIWRSGGGR